MVMDFDFKHLAPYIAPVLLESSADMAGGELLNALVKAASEQAGRSTENTVREVVRISPIDEDGDLVCQAVIYDERARPSWMTVGPERLMQQTFHLIVIAVSGSLAAICASDAKMRDRIVEKQKVARRLPRQSIQAFVGGEARALWLNGVHTPTSSKADTKTLTGLALEDALDPIGDQSYYYSAARTVPKIEGFKKNGQDVLVGAAPAGGRLWLRRAGGWDDFKSLIRVIFEIVANPPQADDPFGLLSQPVESIAGVTDAYGVAVVPAMLLSDDDVDQDDREIALRWAYDARYSVQPLNGPSLKISVELDGAWIGDLELKVSLVDGEAEVASQWSAEANGKDSERVECEQFLANPQRVKVFYDSGHCLAQGRFYEGGYVDQQFEWDFRSFAGYSIGEEKPNVPAGSVLADRIAQLGDTSLFAFIVEKMFVDDEGQPVGWLASDDGSMEAADFIHIDNDCATLTLVHVKAASNAQPGRQAAPADYEVVVGQAIKNLRHLERRHLVDELEKGRSKKIGAAVWHNGVKQQNRDEFLKVAGKLKARAVKRLVVLQPRISKSEREFCWSDAAHPARQMRIKQVETLMLAARASAQACGATFHGIAADD